MIRKKEFTFSVTEISNSPLDIIYEMRFGDCVALGKTIGEMIFNAGYNLMRHVALELRNIKPEEKSSEKM